MTGPRESSNRCCHSRDETSEIRRELLDALREARHPLADDPLKVSQMARMVGDVLSGPASNQAGDSVEQPSGLDGIDPLRAIVAASILLDVGIPHVLRAGGTVDGAADRINRLNHTALLGAARAAAKYVDSSPMRASKIRGTERKQIARELHDGVSHSVGAALVAMDSPGPDTAARDERVRTLLLLALEELIGLTGELRRGSEITDVGGALRDYVLDKGLSDKVGIAVCGDATRIPPSYGEEIYYVTREAVRNAVSHGGGGAAITVSVNVGVDAVSAEVRDNGVGFDVSRESSNRWAHGITGMRERIALLNGTFFITSRPGSGTRVVIRVPLPARNYV